MFKTGIARQHNTVRVHKLTDIVTSLWLGIIVLPKELFNVLCVFRSHLRISYFEYMRV